MLKLAKYLKPFLPGVLLALLLLFGQAMCDLNLPNLMSDIVNTGIQQGGIEHAAPEALSPQAFDLMTAYMTDADRAKATAGYRTVNADDTNASGRTYRSLYPAMGDTVLVLDSTDPSLRTLLDEAFGTAAYRFVSLLQELLSATGQETAELSADGDMAFDMQTAYQVHAMLSQRPSVATASDTAATVAATDGDPVSGAYARQTGAMFAKAFYTELGMDTGRLQTNYIIRIGLYMLLIALLSGAATVLVGLLAPKIASGAARDLRRDIFNKVEHFSQHEFDQFSSASLITRCTNDVTQVQMVVGMGLRMLCYAPIMGIGGIIMALSKSVSMSWIIGLAVLVLMGLVVMVVTVALPRFKIIQQLIDKLNKIARENLSGLMVIRAFGTQAHERERFDAANKELTDVNLFIQRVMAVVFPAITFIMSGVMLLIIWVGANQIAASAMQIGDMMAFMQYAMQIIMSFMMISIMFIFVPRAAVSADRIAEVLSMAPSVTDPEKPQSFAAGKKGLVEFKNVHFRYHNAEQDALSDISFTARPGETTAIIGPTGSGKSTVANLLMRFYDVTQGSIRVDGVDIRTVKQADLRDKIGFVPQKGMLLAGTVASNIRYGRPDATDAEVSDAAAVAQAAEFIEQLPERYEGDIAQGGANVSGGQKQRLSIARALAKNPAILVFDDSFSALDFKTDAALRKALKTHTAEATVIVVAQRVGTIMNAEQIIVLDEGKIVGIGTHDTLLSSCPAYFEIASSQLTTQTDSQQPDSQQSDSQQSDSQPSNSQPSNSQQPDSQQSDSQQSDSQQSDSQQSDSQPVSSAATQPETTESEANRHA